MAYEPSRSTLSVTRLILVPALITLVITLLRLTGELLHWPAPLFSSAEGGGAAIIGITWLPFIFGPYFAARLLKRDERPTSFVTTIFFAVLGILILGCGGLMVFTPMGSFTGHVALGMLLMVLAATLQFIPWKPLARTLIAYAYAARIPVVIVMFFAMQYHWGTHYDAVPAEFATLPFWPKYLLLGIAPQLVMWIVYTMTIGTLFGGIYGAIFHRRKPVEAPSAQQTAGA